MLLTCILLMISASIFSQQKSFDSLKRHLNNIQKIDTLTIDARIDLFSKFFHNIPSDSVWLGFTLKTLELSNQLNYDTGKVVTYQHLGAIHSFLRSEPLKALEYYHKSLKIIDRVPHLDRLTPGSLINIANIYMQQEDYNDALAIYRRLLKKYNKNTVMEQYIANAHGYLNQLDSAIYYYRKAIKSSRIIKNPAFEANNLSNLSLILVKQNKAKESKQAIEKSLEIAKKYQIKAIYSPIYVNAIEVYLLNNNYELVEYYANKVLNLKSTKNNLFFKKIFMLLYMMYTNKKKNIKKL